MICFGSFASLTHLRQDFGLAVSTDLGEPILESQLVFIVFALILEIARPARIGIEWVFSNSCSYNVLVLQACWAEDILLPDLGGDGARRVLEVCWRGQLCSYGWNGDIAILFRILLALC